ncbi:hypothetical protein LWC34_13745 [Kibdelosporangium philippinense]|uniref:Uncharacterized protein n=1 Tax=Kibdelosporangium philippinense TaxID=211113 RepID=A0ABS8ZA19_9PSEU|nr:hypothetical protein [Kibdelosporangium philippinense]MCE7003883.1 hypothetical protein [Kibdelosporangium philippinense]
MTSYEKVREVLDWAVTEAGAPSVAVQIKDENGTWFGSRGPRRPDDRRDTGTRRAVAHR